MSDLIGNELPNETLVFMDKDKGPQPLKILDFCKGKKIVIFGVPGAFTPTCARNHLPGFIENADKIREKAVDEQVVQPSKHVSLDHDNCIFCELPSMKEGLRHFSDL